MSTEPELVPIPILVLRQTPVLPAEHKIPLAMRIMIVVLVILMVVNVAASVLLSAYAVATQKHPNMVYELIGKVDDIPIEVCAGKTFPVTNHIKVSGTPSVVFTYSSWWSRKESLPAGFEAPRPDIITSPDEYTRTVDVKVPPDFEAGLYEWRQAAVDGYAPVTAISVPVQVIACP
jgi:hypothetical protein